MNITVRRLLGRRWMPCRADNRLRAHGASLCFVARLLLVVPGLFASIDAMAVPMTCQLRTSGDGPKGSVIVDGLQGQAFTWSDSATFNFVFRDDNVGAPLQQPTEFVGDVIDQDWPIIVVLLASDGAGSQESCLASSFLPDGNIPSEDRLGELGIDGVRVALGKHSAAVLRITADTEACKSLSIQAQGLINQIESSFPASIPSDPLTPDNTPEAAIRQIFSLLIILQDVQVLGQIIVSAGCR